MISHDQLSRLIRQPIKCWKDAEAQKRHEATWGLAKVGNLKNKDGASSVFWGSAHLQDVKAQCGQKQHTET